ncbi:hypothetical protein Tco_0866558 [Tanacetum coccineum]
MDWLSKRKFVIVCHEKVVRIPLEGDEILRVHGERTQGVMKTLMNTKVDEPKLSDIPVVRDFTDVFPEDLLGLPPQRVITDVYVWSLSPFLKHCGGGLILFQAYGNLYAMTGRKAHLLEDKQIPSVRVFDEVHCLGDCKTSCEVFATLTSYAEDQIEEFGLQG